MTYDASKAIKSQISGRTLWIYRLASLITVQRDNIACIIEEICPKNSRVDL